MDKNTEIVIRQQIAVGANEGLDCLVLGAFGCGAFGNVSKSMAKRYHKLLSEPQHQGLLRLLFLQFWMLRTTPSFGAPFME